MTEEEERSALRAETLARPAWRGKPGGRHSFWICPGRRYFAHRYFWRVRDEAVVGAIRSTGAGPVGHALPRGQPAHARPGTGRRPRPGNVPPGVSIARQLRPERARDATVAAADPPQPP